MGSPVSNGTPNVAPISVVTPEEETTISVVAPDALGAGG